MKRTTTSLIAGWMVWGCGSDIDSGTRTAGDSAGVEMIALADLPSLTDPALLWSMPLEREIPTVGADGEPYVFLPSAILPVGNRLIILDSQGSERLVVLDLDREEVRVRTGREGQGPGEFSGGRLFPGSYNRFRVFDSRNDKLLEYDVEGTLLSETSLSPRGFSQHAEALSESELVVERWEWKEGRSDVKLAKVERNGTVVPFADLPDPPPYEGGDNLQTGRITWKKVGSHFVAMRTTEAYFYLLGATGDLERKIAVELTPRTLTEQDISRQVARYGGIARALRPGPIALTNLLYQVSDTIFGTLQSQLWRAEEDPLVEGGRIFWRLFSTSGRYLGVVPLPPEFFPLWIGEGRVWGRQPDSIGHPVLQLRRFSPPN